MKNDLGELMKKLILTTGALVAIGAPIAAVVSCGNNPTNNKTGGDSQKQAPKPDTTTDHPAGGNQPVVEQPGQTSERAGQDHPNQPAGHPNQDQPVVQHPDQPAGQHDAPNLNERFKIGDREVNVQEDGVYILKRDYKDGVLWSGETLSTGGHLFNDYLPVPETQGFGLDNSLMLGDGDSIYMLYDEDNADGLDPSSFLNNFYFSDTSISADLTKDNEQLGNIRMGGAFGGRNYITFTEGSTPGQGKLRPYLGSQNNHMTEGAGYANIDTFNAQILKLKETMGTQFPEQFEKICKYYGVKVENGAIVDDTSIRNHAARVFAPVFSAVPIFTYEKVASNAYKITYHFDGVSRITAAHFILHSTLNADHNSDVQISSLSLGDKQEWDSYYRHTEATYIAVKNVYHESTQRSSHGDAGPLV